MSLWILIILPVLIAMTLGWRHAWIYALLFVLCLFILALGSFLGITLSYVHSMGQGWNDIHIDFLITKFINDPDTTFLGMIAIGPWLVPVDIVRSIIAINVQKGDLWMYVPELISIAITIQYIKLFIRKRRKVIEFIG